MFHNQSTNGRASNRYKNLKRKDSFRFTHEEEVFLGALCWRLKQEVLNSCAHGNSLYIVQYEKLIQNSEKEIRSILQFLNLQWHDNVLKHHVLHSGISVGKTDSARPIDGNNLDKWKGFLSENDLKTVEKVCADAAKGFYHFSSL